ncbi:hypothetical protein D3C81_1247980 [compost metagenome]
MRIATGSRAVGVLAAVAGEQVDLRQVATLGGLHLLLDRQACVNARLDFRVNLERGLHGLAERLAVGRQGNCEGQGEGCRETHIYQDSFLILDRAICSISFSGCR